MSQYLLVGIIHMSLHQVIVSTAQNLSSLCLEEGRFPHPRECGGYVECVAGGVGSGLFPRVYKCPGGSYHPRLARCVVNKQVPRCSGDKTEYFSRRRELAPVVTVEAPVRSPRHDHLCEGGAGFACASCIHSMVCAGDEAFLQSCPPSTRCIYNNKFPKGVCYPHPSRHQCVCHDKQRVLQDPYDSTAFLLCHTNNPDPEIIYCSHQHEFDADTGKCIVIPIFPSCTASGVFSLPEKCRWFYTCVQDGSNQWQQHHSRCPSHHHVYSQVLGKCTNRDTLPLEDPCSKKHRKISQYRCTFWQVLLVFFFPHKIGAICYS
ncbi:uncharacterized protein LOC121866067 [Homarus americanus]|uniref:Putative Chitin binding Peritrophin-A domain-containing protein 30 n=1 Tax=Homarus americanus TaxID=6706 RepID=A0A8J5K7W4_HOMAM|nr:uncharacterized protein LOC121866067 [Homarus americanus]KAG7169263.1 putative Chitin binding Peritrophin-A domain-containing protein 30 [Homarus americanus]